MSSGTAKLDQYFEVYHFTCHFLLLEYKLSLSQSPRPLGTGPIRNAENMESILTMKELRSCDEPMKGSNCYIKCKHGYMFDAPRSNSFQPDNQHRVKINCLHTWNYNVQWNILTSMWGNGIKDNLDIIPLCVRCDTLAACGMVDNFWELPWVNVDDYQDYL